MTVFLLALLLTSRRPKAADLEFTRVQESWVQQVSPRPPDPVLTLLASPSYRARELGTSLLRAAGPKALPVLTRGLSHPDAEVSFRCQVLMGFLFRCRACGGTAVCRLCRGDAEVTCSCDWQRHCRECNGSGDYRVAYAGREQVGGTPLNPEFADVYKHANLYENRNTEE